MVEFGLNPSKSFVIIPAVKQIKNSDIYGGSPEWKRNHTWYIPCAKRIEYP